MLENKDKTELKELGEFGLIEHLTKNIKYLQKSTIKGVGDDAAVLNMGTKRTVVSTDLLIEGIHFDLSYAPLKHVGYKAIVVNLSDIYAMNAVPSQVTVSIAVSSRFSLEAIEEIYKGIKLACEKYKVDLVGGDTSTSVTGLILSITAIGSAEEKDIVYRNTAKEHDLICVSGDLGAAYLGLQLLEREKKIYLENPAIQPDLEGQAYVVGRILKPEARKDIIKLLKAWEVKPTAMIDISDGLASEALHLAKQSNVGLIIYEDKQPKEGEKYPGIKIPIDEMTRKTALEFSLDPTVCALHGGEDYELLFTVPLVDHDKIKDKTEISIIGHICKPNEGCNLISKLGHLHKLEAQGWNAFKKDQPDKAKNQPDKK